MLCQKCRNKPWYTVLVDLCDIFHYILQVVSLPLASPKEHWSKMTSSNGNIFRVTGPLCGAFACHRWIALTKASDAELWCFLLSAPDLCLNKRLSKRSGCWWFESWGVLYILHQVDNNYCREFGEKIFPLTHFPRDKMATISQATFSNVSNGVSNHQLHDCVLNRLFRHRSKKTSKLRVTGLCAGYSHRWPVNSPRKWSVTRKMFPFGDVIMLAIPEAKPLAGMSLLLFAYHRSHRNSWNIHIYIYIYYMCVFVCVCV